MAGIAVMAGGFCGAVRACVGSGCSLQADEAKDVTYGGEVREVSMPAPEPAPVAVPVVDGDDDGSVVTAEASAEERRPSKEAPAPAEERKEEPAEDSDDGSDGGGGGGGDDGEAAAASAESSPETPQRVKKNLSKMGFKVYSDDGSEGGSSPRPSLEGPGVALTESARRRLSSMSSIGEDEEAHEGYARHAPAELEGLGDGAAARRRSSLDAKVASALALRGSGGSGSAMAAAAEGAAMTADNERRLSAAAPDAERRLSAGQLLLRDPSRLRRRSSETTVSSRVTVDEDLYASFNAQACAATRRHSHAVGLGSTIDDFGDEYDAARRDSARSIERFPSDLSDGSAAPVAEIPPYVAPPARAPKLAPPRRRGSETKPLMERRSVRLAEPPGADAPSAPTSRESSGDECERNTLANMRANSIYGMTPIGNLMKPDRRRSSLKRKPAERDRSPEVSPTVLSRDALQRHHSDMGVVGGVMNGDRHGSVPYIRSSLSRLLARVSIRQSKVEAPPEVTPRAAAPRAAHRHSSPDQLPMLPKDRRGSAALDKGLIMIRARVFSLGQIKMEEQTFTCGFDLHVKWSEQEPGDVEWAQKFLRGRIDLEDRAAPRGLRWEPLVRFPNAVTVTEPDKDLRLYDVNPEKKYITRRSVIHGTFKCLYDLSSFPFDVQQLRIDVQLGREIHTCAELRLPTYRIGHWRGAPNVLMHQIDSEFDYRPMRYVVWTSQILETPTVHSRYSFVIPAQRRSYFYLCNWVLIVLMVQTMAFSVFRFSPKELETRIGTTATLFLVLVQFKLQITDKAPALSYLTLFDKYLITAAVSIFAIFIGSVLLAPVASILHVGEDALDAYLQVAIGATWVFQHYSFIGSARHAKRHQRSRIAAMGKIDDSMVELLRRTKIDVNDDGTVKDEERYKKLINN